MNSRRAATPDRSRVVPTLGPGRLRQTLRTCVILPLGTGLLPLAWLAACRLGHPPGGYALNAKTNPRSCLESIEVRKNEPKTNLNEPKTNPSLVLT